jgi:lysozyme
MTSAAKFIAEFEGFSAKPYLCPAGRWTLGYGDTMWKGKPVTSLTKHITRAEADAALENRLKGFQLELDSMVSVPLTANQNAALVSFIYNIGARSLRTSTLLTMLNRGNYAGAADQLLRWNKAAGKDMAGLTRRREAERKLFLTKG